jgi:hypothetical protein
VKTNRRSIFAISIWLALASISAKSSWAEDYQPLDWVPLPKDTQVLMVYYEYGHHNRYNSTLTGNTKSGTQLYSNIEIVRYLYYMGSWDLNVVVPLGSLNDGKISGVPLGTASGVGDPILSVGGWFIQNQAKKRFLSAATYLIVPIGSYDKHQSLNLGSNRWENDLQANLTQGISRNFTIDVSGDWVYYGVNTQAGTGNQMLSETSSYGAYAWLSYESTSLMHNKLPSFLSVGYMGNFRGIQRLDGVLTGGKDGEQQIRASYTKFLTPTWQILLSVNHDVSVSGQFKQDYGLQFRVAKVFGKKSDFDKGH